MASEVDDRPAEYHPLHVDYDCRFEKDFPIGEWLALFHASDYNGWWTERNADACLDHAFLVGTAWDGDAMVGTIIVQSDGVNSALIDDIVVHPHHRGRGIGSRLLQEALDRLRPLNLDFVQLLPVPGREPYFERFGFVAQAETTVMDWREGRLGRHTST